MALSSTALTPANDPNSLDSSNSASKVYPPQSGTTTTANDVSANLQVLRNQTHTLNEIKVGIAGDTMTDTLEITVSSTNQPGLDVTGNGSSPGINAMGGATAEGGIFAAGGGNKPGIATGGHGTGAGIAATGGATGPGITAVNGTAQTNTAPTCAGSFAGYVQLTGTDPNSTVDPGANNALHGANIPKAWAVIDTSYNVLAGYNIASVTNVAGSIYKVTFVRAMASANYGVSIQQHGAPGGSGSLNSNKNAGDFEFVLYRTTDLNLGFVASATHAYIEVMGHQ